MCNESVKVRGVSGNPHATPVGATLNRVRLVWQLKGAVDHP